MPTCGEHCPFLNRADDRCSANFSLDHLQHAFHHCFGTYQACPVYYELLAERRERRGEPIGAVSAAEWDNVATATSHGTRTLVRLPQLGAQLGARIGQRSGAVVATAATPDRYAKPDAAGEVLSPAPRF